MADTRAAIIVRIDHDVHKRLRRAALERDTTLNAIFVQLAENYLKRIEKRAS
jgi:hypothetical protein